MAQITVDFPDEYEMEMVVGLRSFLGEDADGLTDAQASKKALLRWAESRAKAVNRRGKTATAVTTASAALADKEAAALAATNALETARADADAALRTAFAEYD